MAQVLVRRLDASVVDALKRRARARGRPLEEEIRIILAEAAFGDREALLGEAARLRAETAGGQTADVEALIREARENR